MKNIFITGNKEKEGCQEAAYRIRDYLQSKAKVVGIHLDKELAVPDCPIDIVISLGGDGSFLNLVESLIDRNIPILGINFGRLGFLTAALAGELEDMLDAVIQNEIRITERMVLQLDLVLDDEIIMRRHSLNDVLVASPDLTRVTSLYVKISDEPLIKIRGDGIILSTPTGSTAHSLSVGGSIVDPELEAILLTPMSPQSLSSRPLVVRPGVTIEIGMQLEGHQANIIGDGRPLQVLNYGARVLVSKSPKTIKMVQPKDFMFFQRLREKLGWAEHYLK
ncbi:MAG: NAD(+)/NADH kinase [Planctomycetes bacterium]|nr:NAD(+)/NADH kinase [Planctomycetota bacterium]